jgi:hypothetical protein
MIVLLVGVRFAIDLVVRPDDLFSIQPYEGLQ